MVFKPLVFGDFGSWKVCCQGKRLGYENMILECRRQERTMDLMLICRCSWGAVNTQRGERAKFLFVFQAAPIFFFYSYQLKCHLSYLCCDAFIYLFIYSVSGGNIFISGASDLWSIEVQNIFLLEVYWILLRVISARANQYAVLSLCLNNFLTSFKVWMHWTFHSLVTQL